MNSMRKIQKILIGVFVCGVLMGGVGTGIAFIEYSSFAYGGEKKVGEEHLVTRQLDHTFDPARGRIAVDADWSWREYGDCQILADPSVPEHVIRYEVTYNEKEVRPYLIYDEFEEDVEDGEESEVAWDMEVDDESEAARDAEGDDESEAARDVGGEEESEAVRDGEVEPDSGGTRLPQEPTDIPDHIQARIFLGVRHIGNDFATWMECKEDFLRELKQKRISYYDRIGLVEVKIRVNPATMPYTKDLSE